MYARSMSGREDWTRIENTIPFVRDRMRPQITAVEGNLGLCVLLALQSRRFVVISGWQDEAAMHASDPSIAPLRAEATELLGGETSVREWKVAALRNRGGLRIGNWISVAHLQRDPSTIDAVLRAFRTAVLPATDGLRGCRGALLLVNTGTGDIANAVIFDGYTALHGARKKRAPIHDLSAAGVGVEAVDVTDYELDSVDGELPESF